MKGGDNEWQLIAEKMIAIHGTGVKIAPNGQQQIMLKQQHRVDQVLENSVTNVWEKKRVELAANKINGRGIS